MARYTASMYTTEYKMQHFVSRAIVFNAVWFTRSLSLKRQLLERNGRPS